MKLRYPRIIVTIVIIALASFATGALAASNIQEIKAFLRHDFQVFVGGKKVDVGPVLIYDNKSYLPLAKIGDVLGAEVNWNQSNLGIYVNPRIYTKPDPTEDGTNYTSITMYQMQGYTATYRGKETQVLSAATTDYQTTYYRVKDIQRLDIDLSGLHLAKETRTGELYVSNKELDKAVTDKPKFNYAYGKLVIGETNPDKLEVVENFIDGLPAMYKALNYKDPLYPELDYYTIPQIFVIDALPDNEYNIYGIENSRFKHYWLKLKQNIYDNWYQSEHKIYDLGSTTPQY